MSFFQRVKDDLKGMVQVEGRPSRLVVFSRLILVLFITLWDILFLIYGFALLSLFHDWMVLNGAKEFAQWLATIWGSITIVVIAIRAYVWGLNKVGVWSRREN